MSVPVLVIGFNRPSNVRAVLSAVHSSEPESLIFAVDGPRAGRGEEAVVRAVQSVVDEFSWTCPVIKLFRDTNVGVRRNVAEAIDSLFNYGKAGIVLEDDCNPTPDFFVFANACLAKYVDNPKVGMVAGSNFLGSVRRDHDALFSEGHIWGWATWKDRWDQHRETSVSVAETVNASKYYGVGWPYRRRLARAAESGRLNSWAIPWLLGLAERDLYCAIPARNLVSNIGHDSAGTHTSGGSKFAALAVSRMPDYIRLPDLVVPDKRYQWHYAMMLNFEFVVHAIRRPVVRVLRRIGGA